MKQFLVKYSKEVFKMNALILHLLAMLFMLIDHMWATVIPGNMWMNFVGRLAFPIFCFYDCGRFLSYP